MEKLWIMMQKKKVIPDGVFQSKTNIVQTELVLKYNRQIQLMEVPNFFFFYNLYGNPVHRTWLYKWLEIVNHKFNKQPCT